MEITDEGEVIDSGRSVAEYEAMKRVGEFKLPGKAEVVEKNSEVKENPEKINESPYEYWLVKIKPLENFRSKLLSNEKAQKYYDKQM